MREKLLEMLEMQKALNEDILKKHGSEKYTDDNLYHALLDELGELNHELKAEWCRWKKTQKPVDREKLLEEYVDCIHFGLCHLLKYSTNLDSAIYAIINLYDCSLERHMLGQQTNASFIINLLDTYLFNTPNSFALLLLLGNKLGFDFDTIYEAYIKKNKVNYERLKNGY